MMPDPVDRRALLLGALALPLVACAGPAGRPAPPQSPAPSPGPRPDPAHFAALERKYGARLGVFAVATGTGASLAYRADERFALCSTFKTLAAAAVLHRHPVSYLQTVIRYRRADIDSFSPITEQHVATGMTVGRLCDAALRYSDGTAGNLLMRDAGGPAGLTAYLRGLGDRTGRMDQYEPQLNRNAPDDPRDTGTPRSLAADYRAILLGTALPPDKRALIVDWLRRNTTGAASIRAGVPHGWTVADKTGHGDYGRGNDVAVLWPPARAPLVLAVLSDRHGYGAAPQLALIADAARYVTGVLG